MRYASMSYTCPPLLIATIAAFVRCCLVSCWRACWCVCLVLCTVSNSLQEEVFCLLSLLAIKGRGPLNVNPDYSQYSEVCQDMLSLSPFPSSPPVHRSSTPAGPSSTRGSLVSRMVSAPGSSIFSAGSSSSSSTRRRRPSKRPRPRPARTEEEEEEIDEDEESMPTVTGTLYTTRGGRSINETATVDGSHALSSSFMIVDLIDEATCVLPDVPVEPVAETRRGRRGKPCYDSPLHRPRNAKVSGGRSHYFSHYFFVLFFVGFFYFVP